MLRDAVAASRRMALLVRVAKVALLALALLTFAPTAQAQVTEGKPIKLKQPKIKKDKFKGTVVSATLQGITVRHEKDMRVIRTFQLSEKAGAQMLKAFDKGGFQVGDKVTIVHPIGAEVALEIKGKPSISK